LVKKVLISFLVVLSVSSSLLVSGCSGMVALIPTITSTNTPLPTMTPPPPTFTAIPATLTPNPTATILPPTDTPFPSAMPTLPPPTKTSTLPAPVATSEEPFIIVRIEPSQGSLADLLAQEVKKAEALGLTSVVYFDATW
jgi:hypothetical protein